MSEKEDKSLDILGIKPIADSVNTITKASVDGASAFLSRICLPAAEEFGILLRDKVSGWRAKNAVLIINKAQVLLEQQVDHEALSAHPRLIYATIESGSWTENDLMQNLWAGLLASSCTQDGNDESNLIFIGILSQLTNSQAILIKYTCENVVTFESEAGWIGADDFNVTSDELEEIMGINDLQRIDRELDHLRSLELIVTGFPLSSTVADITPHPLCLQLYVRCQGYVGSPIDYFGAVKKQSSDN